jgi:hypothetical protein
MKRLLLLWSVLAIARTVCLATAVAEDANCVQPGRYCYEWLRPEKTKVEKTGSFQTAGGVEEFKVPFVDPAVLYIAAEKNDNLSLTCGGNAAEPGEALYNGIVLPSPWPPQPATWPYPEPVAPPYLVSPPSVISIDVGRQLFVDDFLIEETTLQRSFHLAEYYPGNPVLQPDQPWESKDGLAEAMAFSDGVWFDPKDNLFKVWYVSGKESCTCYATSADGIHWDKPALDVEPPSNIVLRQVRDSATVWLDLDEKDPQRRFKMVLFAMDGVERNKPLELRHSPDGIHWSPVIASNGYPANSIYMDRTTMFYNPFRRLWVLSLRDWDEGPQRTARCRYYVETPDLEPLGTLWQDKSTLSKWASADRLDRLPGTSFAQLYNLDAVAYESLLLGAFSINTANADRQTGRPKINQVKLGYSRDGFHWYRPDRRVFLARVGNHQRVELGQRAVGRRGVPCGGRAPVFLRQWPDGPHEHGGAGVSEARRLCFDGRRRPGRHTNHAASVLQWKAPLRECGRSQGRTSRRNSELGGPGHCALYFGSLHASDC